MIISESEKVKQKLWHEVKQIVEYSGKLEKVAIEHERNIIYMTVWVRPDEVTK